VLQDENANTTFNLVTGALTSKNLTIDSTYFKLNNTGKITSITADGRKLEMDMGKITGYKVDGTQSAALEIGDGYFNIIGKLALNGVVGVSGATSFVKGITYETEEIFDNVPIGGGYEYRRVLNDSTSLSAGTQSVTIPQQQVQITVPAGGGTVYVSIPSQTISVPSYTLNKTTDNFYAPSSVGLVSKTYLKAVAADTGAINSADGLIQSIS
jgi:hypothetical protein